MWNRHVHNYRIFADSNVPNACEVFASLYGPRWVRSALAACFYVDVLVVRLCMLCFQRNTRWQNWSSHAVPVTFAFRWRFAPVWLTNTWHSLCVLHRSPPLISIVARQLRQNFVLHLFNLWDACLVSSRTIARCISIVDGSHTALAKVAAYSQMSGSNGTA